MAHEIEGDYAFFASGKPAWHGIGNVLKDAPSIQEAWNMAYPHELYRLPIESLITDESGEIIRTPFKSGAVIVRDDGTEIGLVGSGFELVQPWQVFEAFEPMIDKGLIELEAGGSLQDGKRMWVLAKVKNAEAEILPGDSVKTYVLMYTGFDGSLSLGVSPTGVRVVCANTLAMARADGIQFKHRHTKSVHENIDKSMLSIEKVLANHAATVEVYRSLARKQVTREKQEQFIADVILTPEVAANPETEITPQAETKINRVIELLDTQRGMELVPAMRGTAWQAYNAVTEFITHESGRTPETGLNAQWFGTTATMNRQALELARSL